MTIDEAIKREKEIHKDNQMVVETHIVHENFTLEELYCDDTEVVEEHLENYRFTSEYHKQIAEWLEEFKALKEKSVAKKPIRRKGMCYAKAKDGTEDYEIIEECPTCKNQLYAVSFNVGYCRCGQKITV